MDHPAEVGTGRNCLYRQRPFQQADVEGAGLSLEAEGLIQKAHSELAEVMTPHLETALGTLDPGVAEPPVGTELECEVEVKLSNAPGRIGCETTNAEVRLDGQVELLILVVAAAGGAVELELGTNPELDLSIEETVSSQSSEPTGEILPLRFDLNMPLLDLKKSNNSNQMCYERHL